MVFSFRPLSPYTTFSLLQMNLASRCREAISHVAMLKKELAMHQRRAAEAMQRQQMQQYVRPC